MEALQKFKIAKANELAIRELKDCYPEDGLKENIDGIYGLKYWIRRVRLTKTERLIFQ